MLMDIDEHGVWLGTLPPLLPLIEPEFEALDAKGKGL